MQRPHLRLLGSATFSPSAGGDMALRSERRDQLLCYLACRVNWVEREHLAELFWGDRGDSAARGNLRFVVLQLRRAGFEGLEVRPTALRWNPTTDLAAFQTAIDNHQWQTALDLWSGPLLQGFEVGAPPGFDSWLQFERARLQALWHDAVSARLQELTEDPASCMVIARTALAHDPLNESAVAALLQAELALGRRVEAQRDWKAYTESLASHHGLEPSAELLALAARLNQRQGAANPSPAPAPVDCIGRRSEQAQLLHLLDQPNCRLLTVTGPGGVGKSTLARAVMPRLQVRFDQHAYWVELDDLPSTDDVAVRLAARLGLQPSANGAPLDQVIEHLACLPSVLVFDNAEHLVGFAPLVEVLLQRCPSTKLLITSRARTAARGEWLLPLEGLPAPDLDEQDVEVLRAFDSVQLFDLRARAGSPSFALAKHATDVVELIHAVEGLPLALELTARLTRLLPVKEILKEVRQSLTDLEGEATAEHSPARSLRASFNHSWRMLASLEREVLPRLGVFVGNFSRSAAEYVAQASLPVLGGLVDKSLLRADGEGRFSLHPLLKQYVLEHLCDPDVAVRHAEHYAQFLARHGENAGAEAVAEIELEWPNCQAAWHASVAAGLHFNVERMARSLWPFFAQRGRLEAGIELMETAIRQIRPSNRAASRALAAAHRGLAFLLVRRARLSEGEAAAREALRQFAYLRDRKGVSDSLFTLGLCLWQQADYEGARRCYERGLRRACEDGAGEDAYRFESGLALVEEALGRYEHAIERHQAALARQRKAGDYVAQLITLNNLGTMLSELGDAEAALSYLEEGRQFCTRANCSQYEPFLLSNLARTHLQLNHIELAESLATTACALAKERGARQPELESLLISAESALAADRHDLAAQRTRDYLQATQGKGIGSWQASAFGVYASAAAGAGHRVLAATFWHLMIAGSKVRAATRTNVMRDIERLALSAAESEEAKAAAASMTVSDAVSKVLSEPWPRSSDRAVDHAVAARAAADGAGDPAGLTRLRSE
jgi:predicted ATPase/DNA-binding SARP family transcriptional activator